MLLADAHACTDITGFGLLGHLRNVVAASGCSAVVRWEGVPVMDAARRYVKQGIAPGGTHANWRFLGEHVAWPDTLEKEAQLVLCDAQTSGGLLIAVAPDRVGALVAELERRGTPAAAVIGQLEEGQAGRMRVE
jgi:selenide,water dikinase